MTAAVLKTRLFSDRLCASLDKSRQRLHCSNRRATSRSGCCVLLAFPLAEFRVERFLGIVGIFSSFIHGVLYSWDAILNEVDSSAIEFPLPLSVAEKASLRNPQI